MRVSGLGFGAMLSAILKLFRNSSGQLHYLTPSLSGVLLGQVGACFGL